MQSNLPRFPGLPGSLASQCPGRHIQGQLGRLAKAGVPKRKASDKCSQGNNVSLQVEMLVKSASAGRTNNTGQVINLPGSDGGDELTHLSGSAILAAELIQIKPIIF